MAAIAMEFVEGTALSHLREQRVEECFDAADLELPMAQLCEALRYAHTRLRVVHGEIKPTQLLIDADGNLKVTAFGFAGVFEKAMGRTLRVPEGAAPLPYRSPQRALGALPCEADDIYAVGAVIYEMITSQPPFYRGDIATQIQSSTVPSMTVRREALQIQGAPIPPAWEAAVAACLAKQPEDRPPSAEALANLLGIGLESVTKGSDEHRPAVSASAARRDARVLLIAGAFLIGGALVWTFEHARLRRAPPPIARAQAGPGPTPASPATPPPVSIPSTPEPALLTLAPPKTGSIFINTLPAGAVVFLDDERKGLSPMRLENVPLRSSLLVLQKDGYERKELMLSAGPGGLRQPPLIELVRKPSEPPRAPPSLVALPPSTPPPSTPRPLATPAPAPPSPTVKFQPTAMAESETPEAVVKAYVQALMTADPAPYLQLCAPRVDFFDDGVQTHERIRRDRKNLAERWPIYRVQNVRDLAIEDTIDPEAKRVAFSYDWEVSNPAKKLDRSGTARDTLDLHKTGGRWLITRMRQERVAR